MIHSVHSSQSEIRRYASRLSVAAACLLAALGATPAQAVDLPGISFGTGTAIDPAAALTVYGNPTSPAAPAAADPLVAELARSLNYDIDLIFEHVRDNVAFVPIYGLQKGAVGALHDESGTAFDQAHLFVELLRESDRVAGRGYNPRYKLGRIAIGGTQFADWFGISNPDAAKRVVANGGIPATVGSKTIFGYPPLITTVTMSHIWVEATVGGATYSFDPSLKPHVRPAKINVASISGYNRSALLNAAGTGATFDATSIRNFNTPAFNALLTQYRASLENYLRANLPGRKIGTVVGAPEIVPHPASENRRTTLPYVSAVDATWTGAIPNPYRTSVTLTMGSGTSGTLYADEIYGKQLQFNFGYVNGWNLGGYYTETMTSGGDPCSNTTTPVGSKPLAVLSVAINHPYAASSGTYMDRTLTKPMTNALTNGGCTQGFFLFTMDFGAEGTGRLADVRREAAKMTLAPTVSSGLLTAPTLKNVGVTFSRYLQLADHQLDLVTQVHDLVGVHNVDFAWSRKTSSVTQWTPELILALDFEGGVSSASRLGIGAPTIQAAKDVAAMGLALAESAVPRQELDSTREVSPLSLVADQDQLAATPGQYRHFVAYPGNWSTVRPQLQQYGSEPLASLDAYIAAGYMVLVPERGDLTLGTYQIGGISVKTTDEASGNSFFRQGFLAFRSGSNGIDSAGMLTFNPRHGRVMKGGAAVQVQAPDGRGLTMPDVPKPEPRDPVFSALEINPRNGSVSYSPPPDLRDGSGEFPFSLTFQRTYNNLDISDVGLGVGWSHNWKHALSLQSDSLAIFGENGALGAASALVAQQAAYDLGTSGAADPRTILALVKSHQWLANQSVNNLAVVDDPVAGSTSFARMADGSFGALRPDSGRLVQSGAPVDTMLNRWAYHPVSFLYTLPDGAQRSYAYVGAENPDLTLEITAALLTRKTFYPSTWVHPTGVKLSTLFQREPLTGVVYMHQVGNSLGNFISTQGITVGDEGNSAYCTYPYNNQPVSYRPYSPGSIKYRDSALNEVVFERTPAYAFRVSILFIEDGGNCGMTGQIPGTTRISVPNLVAASNAAAPGQPAGPKWTYQNVVGGVGAFSAIAEIYKPSNATTPAVRIAYGADGNVRSVTNALSASSLYRSSVHRFESEDPLGARSASYFDDLIRPTRSIDPLGANRLQVYDDAGELIRTVAPEGDAIEYLYDARGNKLRECRIAKGRVNWAGLSNPKAAQCNAALGDLVTTITYVEAPTLRMEQCVNLKTCNQPATVTDPNGNRTDYSWSGVHGGMLSQIRGLNASGACMIAGGCPQITYGYSSFTGSDGATFYRLSSKSEKIDAAAATVTAYAYDAANKFVLSSVTADSGGLNLRTCAKYDALGNMISLSDPRQVICP